MVIFASPLEPFVDIARRFQPAEFIAVFPPSQYGVGIGGLGHVSPKNREGIVAGAVRMTAAKSRRLTATIKRERRGHVMTHEPRPSRGRRRASRDTVDRLRELVRLHGRCQPGRGYARTSNRNVGECLRRERLRQRFRQPRAAHFKGGGIPDEPMIPNHPRANGAALPACTPGFRPIQIRCLRECQGRRTREVQTASARHLAILRIRLATS